jgi:hypothetical protein
MPLILLLYTFTPHIDITFLHSEFYDAFLFAEIADISLATGIFHNWRQAAAAIIGLKRLVLSYTPTLSSFIRRLDTSLMSRLLPLHSYAFAIAFFFSLYCPEYPEPLALLMLMAYAAYFIVLRCCRIDEARTEYIYHATYAV